MLRFGLNVLLIVWSVIGLTQESMEWRDYVVAKIPNDAIISERIFLVEAGFEEVREAYPDLQILRSIDGNHHIVRGNPKKEKLKAWSVNDKWKLNIGDRRNSDFYIVTTDAFDTSILKDFKTVKHYADRNTFLIEGSLARIEDFLLHNKDVIHITNKVSRPFVESRVIDLNLNPNKINKVHHFYPELNGSTETVSIQENQFDVGDLDLLNRNLVSGLESEMIDNHATEMATILAGAGNSFVTGKGVAQEATLVSSDFFDAMPDSDSDYSRFDINTQNHSYGIPRASEYGVEARAFDQSAHENENLLHVFSSGNEGGEIPTDGVYSGIAGYANLTGNIKMSKNSLVVGSVDTVGAVPAFVSRGPTYDGRVKPEIVAYSVVGSSNSAALTSGIVTLLQQQYSENYLSDMPSALAKALLINGAEDVGPKGLDFITGYGNVNAWQSLEALRNGQFFSGQIENGEVESFVLDIPSNAVNLKVTLCWTDLPANVNDFPALVNNLDLRLVHGSEVTLPWVLDQSPSNLSNVSVRGIDELNNVEQVTIQNPELNYSIEVEGNSVNGSQNFYLAWQYEQADSFEWDYPTGSDNMPYNGETGSYFRWSTTKTGTGTLAYTSDDMHWLTLDPNVDLQKEYWRWNNPPILNDDVRARMEVDGDFFETELFTVSSPLPTSVGFNCGDSLMLRWTSIPSAQDYTVFRMGDEKLEEYQTTMDTFLIVSNASELENPYFAIQPNLDVSKSLLSSPAFDYSIQGIDCYIFSFFQTVALDTGIYLNLSLGTTIGIDRIVLERNNFYDFEEIEVLTELNSELVLFLDKNPNQGYNEHQAKVYFQNGEVLTMSAGTTFYLTDEPLKIAPNPILAGEELFISTREFDEVEPIFELLDYKGVIVYSKVLQGTQDFVPTQDLNSGIYFYRLKADNQVFTGRILVR